MAGGRVLVGIFRPTLCLSLDMGTICLRLMNIDMLRNNRKRFEFLFLSRVQHELDLHAVSNLVEGMIELIN